MEKNEKSLAVKTFPRHASHCNNPNNITLLKRPHELITIVQVCRGVYFRMACFIAKEVAIKEKHRHGHP